MYKYLILFISILIIFCFYIIFKEDEYEKFEYEYTLTNGYLFRNNERVLFIKFDQLTLSKENLEIEVKFSNNNYNILDIKY